VIASSPGRITGPGGLRRTGRGRYRGDGAWRAKGSCRLDEAVGAPVPTTTELPPIIRRALHHPYFTNPTTIERVARGDRTSEDATKPGWTFLTNHGHVLVCIASDPGIRGRDIADQVGITERAAQAIIADLVGEGYVTRTRVGRRNHYDINRDLPLRHPVEQPHSVGELLQLVVSLAPPGGHKTTAS